MQADPVLATVIAVVALLLIAAAAAIGLKRIRFPFTVGLVLVGIALGGLQHQVEALSILSSFSLSPDLILFVFLPTLIFESAFNMDVRLLSRNLAPVITLAAPGLVLSTVIVGALVTTLTPLTWGPALVFGALISATDPVSVIALFKDVGAPKRLTILVEGESLFNDATAIVLFAILLSMIGAGSGGGETVGQGLLHFLRVFIGGLAVGVVAGYLMVLTISLAEDEPLVEVAFSTVVAYAAFITAEHYLNVSGVMATVGAGVVVGTLGSTRFTPELKAYLRQFWGYAAFVAKSLIFLLVGLSVSLRMLAEYAGPIGWAILAVLVARAATVFGLVPIVNRLPNAEPVNLRYQSIMYWGGLRGAVALALALSLPTTFVFRDLVLALTIGIVLFTLLSGGIAMKPLIRALGLDRPGVVDLVAQAQGVVAAKRKALGRIEELGTAGKFSGTIVADLAKRYRQELDHAEGRLDDLCTGPNFRDGTMRQVLLTQALTVERRTYQEFFAQGRISEAVLHELELSVDLERDALRRGVTSSVLPTAEPLEVRVAGIGIRFLERFVPTSTAVLRHRVRTLAANYERDSAVHAASERVIDTIRHLAELAKVDGSVEAGCRKIYEERAAKSMERIDALAEHFPEYASAVQRRTARRIALDAEADAVEELAAAGELPDTVAREARQRVEAAQRDLARRPVAPMKPDPEELLTKVPFFKELALDDFQRVAEVLVPRTVLPGERIIKQGERGTSLFLIARGVVAVLVASGDRPPRRVASLHAGDFFGEMALLSDDPRNATVEAVTAGQLYELSKSDVDGLCEVCEGVKQALTAAALARKVSTARSEER
ncbi:MAG: cation:proton antiporter [Gemmatimonadetes bacterium]|nr:cation:proton antiporter [Gemmatimonadota bacterium]